MNKYITSNEMEERISAKLDVIRKLFEDKNVQYATNDALANFTLGGRIMFGDDSMASKYGALKAYVLKHISHIYNNGIDGHKVDESVMDVVVYFLIASVMIDIDKEGQA